jgi:hypothetical protein
MPAFHLRDFANYALDTLAKHPLWFLLLASTLLIVAFRLMFLSGAKVTHRHELDDVEPEPIRRRVVLDATARFPPRASDRRAS